MEQLSIAVRAPDGVERRYLFSRAPVLIGRSPDCDVSILHEAVPRHLCRVWPEDGGRRVRVEESPGLTNPLELGGRPVVGGASGERLELRVGPIGIAVGTAAAVGGSGGEGRRSGGRRLRSAIGAAGIAAATAALALLGAGPSREAGSPDGLPESLFEREPASPPTPPGGRVPGESARLVATGAGELLSRPAAPCADRVRAVAALRRAGAAFAGAGDRGAARACGAEADRAAAEIDRAWRLDRLALRRSLAAGDDRSAAAAAARLLDCLPASDEDGRRALKGIAGARRGAEGRALP